MTAGITSTTITIEITTSTMIIAKPGASIGPAAITATTIIFTIAVITICVGRRACIARCGIVMVRFRIDWSAPPPA